MLTTILVAIAAVTVGYLLIESILLVRDLNRSEYQRAHLRTARMAVASIVLMTLAGLGAVLTVRHVLEILQH